MYSLFDESGSLSNSGSVVEDAMVVDEGSRVRSGPLPLHRHDHHYQHHHHHHHHHRNGQQNDENESSNQQQQDQRQQHREIRHHREENEQQHDEQITELEEFLRCRATDNQEMVAQDMAQSYNELVHTSQEPQEFISLEELRPHVLEDHQTQAHSVSTSNTSAHLYPGNQNQQNTGAHQQRTYYNLSSTVQDNSCTTVYFGDIGECSGVSELGVSGAAGEALPPAPTPTQTSNNLSVIENNTASNNSFSRGSSSNNKKKTNDRIEPVVNNNQRNSEGAETATHMDATSSGMVVEQASASGRHYHQLHHHHHHHPRSTNNSVPGHGPQSNYPDNFSPVSRKRKVSLHDDNDLLDDAGDDVKCTRTNADSKKQNHSEIEKRRRDKMNTYITELSAMVPMCHAMSRKLDKLTVLRMAVQHLKTILGAVTSYTEGHYKPTFLSDQELKTLILQAAEGFVFVVGCDRGRILYVSESVTQTLNYSQDDLLGQSWFDILHPKDVAKVKEQLSSSDLSPRERLIDAKTMLPVKTDVPHGVSRLCPGTRRSFFCRMKRKVDASGGESRVKEEADTTTTCHRRKKQQNVDWKYCVIHCTGYLKSWAPAKIGLEETEGDADADGEGCNLSCLVAVGRVQQGLPAVPLGPTIPRLRTIEFISRHAIDGKFLFVDQRATLVLGFLPQELLGTSMYEYYHHDDIPHLADSHKAALQTAERVTTRVYRFRAKGASFIKLQSEWKSFRNPWTKDIEYLISKNSVVHCESRQMENSVNRSEGSSVQDNYDYFAQSNGGLERLISSHVEMSKIGRRIADEVLDNQRRSEDSSSGGSPIPAPERALLNTEIQTIASPERIRDNAQTGMGTEISSNQTSTYNQIRNNVQLTNIANDQGAPLDEDMMEIIGGTVMSESPNPLPSDGNDEAAMAVIMSLLEADAGLGGPVDFSGLPWPLP